MPNIRVMNWNIEQFSINKVNIAGMATALARTVAAANVDILVVLEVKITNVAAAMLAFSNALNAADGGGNNWLGYFLSYGTGKEYYCVFIRNFNLIRPVVPIAANGQDGTSNHPLIDLKKNAYNIWPNANWAATAYPLPAPLPRIPLVNLYKSPPRARATKRSNFGGQAVGNGGYSLGRGYRLPAMALCWVHTGAGDYLVPIIMCHYAAVRGGRNALAQFQVAQLKDLHIAQLYNSNPAGGGNSGYLDVMTGAPLAHTTVQVQEICYTGDYNLDFLENSNAMGASHEQLTNRSAYNNLTPTQQQGGSAGPGAAPGAAGAAPPLPYAPPWAPGPGLINNQALRAAVTTQGTIMQHYPLPAPLPVIPPAPYGASAFDNFIYGGTRLNTAAAAFGTGGVDSGDTLNVPANVVQQGGVVAAGQIDLSAVAAYYVGTGTKNAAAAPGLQANVAAMPPPAALTANERLIGARMLSDHLPVVLQFNCP